MDRARLVSTVLPYVRPSNLDMIRTGDFRKSFIAKEEEET